VSIWTVVDEQLRAMVIAWREAALDLKIRVVVPWLFTDENGRRYEVLAFLPDFGGPRGMVNGNLGYTIQDEIWEALEKTDYYYSALNPSAYGTYDRSRWIETLNDWGWFGSLPESPDWYAGYQISSSDWSAPDWRRSLTKTASGSDVPPDINHDTCGGRLPCQIEESLRHLLVEVRLSAGVTNVSRNVFHYEGHPFVGNCLVRLTGPQFALSAQGASHGLILRRKDGSHRAGSGT